MPRLSPADPTVTIELDGDQLQAREGEPIACAVLASDELIFSRSPKYHRPRGPFCMTGACAQCLMRVDGIPNVAHLPHAGEAGHAPRAAERDARRQRSTCCAPTTSCSATGSTTTSSWRAGPSPSRCCSRSPAQLSGLGVLPERAAAAREPAVVEEHDLVMVGAGAAGLAAARQLTMRGVKHVLFERDPHVGGRLTSGAEAGQPAPWNAPARLGAEVVGLFADDGKPFLAVIENERLHLVFYRAAAAGRGRPRRCCPPSPTTICPG